MQLASCTSRLNSCSVGVVASFIFGHIFWHKNGGTSHGSCYGLRRTAAEERLRAEAFIRTSDAEGWRWSEQVFSYVPSSPLSGTAPSILIILRLGFRVIFVVITWYLQPSQYYNSIQLPPILLWTTAPSLWILKPAHTPILSRARGVASRFSWANTTAAKTTNTIWHSTCWRRGSTLPTIPSSRREHRLTAPHDVAPGGPAFFHHLRYQGRPLLYWSSSG